MRAARPIQPVRSGREAAAPGHTAQLYESEAELGEAVARFLGAAIGAGDAGLLIATPRHRSAIEERLGERGLDLAKAHAAGRYLALDAAETLSALLVDGTPDAEGFAAILGGALARLESARGARVSAYGEMVALLWEQGRREAALQLERLWDALARERGCAVLCGYPLAAFQGAGDDADYGRVRDAHEELSAGGALVQRELTLPALIEASPLPIVMTDLDTTIRLWNPAAERVFGWLQSEVIGRPSPIIPPEKTEESARLRESVARGESCLGLATRRLRRDGGAADVLISAAPIRDALGFVTAAVLIFEDVTDRNRAERERQEALTAQAATAIENARLYDAERRARGEAEAANRAKDEFLAMLGHELRNPLAAVRNAVVTAQLGGDARARALDIARRGVDQLARLVDDLLDVARITQGRIALQRRTLPFADAVGRAVESARQTIEERAHSVRVVLPEGELLVEADATRLEQVAANLITNAVKYTDPGGRIEIQVAREADDAVLRVRDNGIGIARDMLPRVFDLFAQAERTLDRALGGLGIGLTLTKRLVELHGGRVEAHSEGPGRGAEFVVRLPAASGKRASDDAEAPPPRAPSARGPAHVLVVEDNEDAADSLGMLLEILGHRVVVVHDGPGALRAAQAQPPDVMLVDIGLPGMDGYEVARRIREDGGLSGVRLVALTGYGRDEDRRRAIEAGFDHHLVKPVSPEALEDIVAS